MAVHNNRHLVDSVRAERRLGVPLERMQARPPSDRYAYAAIVTLLCAGFGVLTWMLSRMGAAVGR